MRDETQHNLEDAALGRLSIHDIDAQSAERIRTRAHAILAGQRPQGAHRSGFAQAYARFLEPLLVSGIVVSYLIWAAGRALTYYHIL